MNTDEKQVVLSRLETMPSSMILFVGDIGYNKEELIRHVEREDRVGEFIVLAHMNYLRSFKKANRFGE